MICQHTIYILGTTLGDTIESVSKYMLELRPSSVIVIRKDIEIYRVASFFPRFMNFTDLSHCISYACMPWSV